MTGRCHLGLALFPLVALGLGAPDRAGAQTVTYRGFAEAGITGYPQTAPNDSTQTVADALFRFDPSIEIPRRISAAASIEARIASHDLTTADVTFWDRSRSRPTLGVRTLAATIARGPLTLEIGKQFVRWGQSDILSPTDHFTPRDYLLTISSEALATTAARLTVAGQSTALELVYTPRMTPSRMPLLDQRWIGLQAAQAGLPLENGETSPPGGAQYGVRWHHNTRRVEYSGTFFHGFNHLPVLDVTLATGGQRLQVNRKYPAIRAWGGDAAIPLSVVSIKAEADWVQAPSHDSDDYGLWVIQAERQQGEWLFIGGYVGEWVSAARGVVSFAPDRGLARGVIGRASYTVGTHRSVVLETVTRRNGDGFYAKVEYSQSIASNWRLTLQFVGLGGDPTDFLGQYRRNSFTRDAARYSF